MVRAYKKADIDSKIPPAPIKLIELAEAWATSKDSDKAETSFKEYARKMYHELIGYRRRDKYYYGNLDD